MVATREDIRRAAGKAIFCGFDGIDVTPELSEVLREARPAGVVLFARNVESPPQVADLCRRLKSLPLPDGRLMCAVDQEGGRVARIRQPATEWPCMRDLGRTSDPKLGHRFGRALAQELRALNFDVDFAPVLDVDTNPDNPVIGDRSLGSDPEAVSRLAVEIIRGLQEEGIAACGKHFPGHGDTDKDSHLDLPRVSHDRDRLRATEWVPFRAAIDADVSAIMSAHVVVEPLDEKHPATLSPSALGPLRTELGFSGVIVSDDIEMKAIAARYTLEQIATYGVGAGIDLFLACHDPEVIMGVYRGLVVGAECRDIDPDDLLDAERRIDAWRSRYCHPGNHEGSEEDVVGCMEHQALAAEIRAAAARANNEA